jgi:hypothetical protein
MQTVDGDEKTLCYFRRGIASINGLMNSLVFELG